MPYSTRTLPHTSGLLPGQCPRCLAPSSGKGSWRTLSDCHVCGDACCSECAVEDEQGLVCGKCVAKLVDQLMADGDVTEVLS